MNQEWTSNSRLETGRARVARKCRYVAEREKYEIEIKKTAALHNSADVMATKGCSS